MPSLSRPPKTALVTGAARRLGAAFALDLARRGWDLWLHYHQSEADAKALADRIAGQGSSVRLVSGDLSAPGGAEALVSRLEERPPALIVHSASLWTEDTAATATPEAWEASHRLHSWTAVILARALTRWHPQTGHLVTVLDSRLRDRDPGHFSYAFAKRELAALTRYLAAEFAPGIRVNGLAPGLILRAGNFDSARWNRAALNSTPLARAGRPADLVRALRYLIDSPYVTGQILAVDGGRHLKGDLFGSI